MGKLENEYFFSYDKLQKGWRKGNSLLYAYPEDSALYVVKYLLGRGIFRTYQASTMEIFCENS